MTLAGRTPFGLAVPALAEGYIGGPVTRTRAVMLSLVRLLRLHLRAVAQTFPFWEMRLAGAQNAKIRGTTAGDT